MNKPFWHRLSFKQQQAIFDFKDPERKTLLGLPEGLTVWEFREAYRQPRWCSYPQALTPMMGCWSLMSRSKKMIHSKKDCGSCECIIEVRPKT